VTPFEDRTWLRAAALALALALAGCPRHESSDRCSTAALNTAVLATAQDWYLFADTIPAAIDPAAYATPAALLDAITANARAQGKDRHFSFLTTVTQAQQFYTSGQSLGYGFVQAVRGTQLFVASVLAGSAAADAGFARGDEILSIGTSAADQIPMTTLLAEGTLGSTLSSSVLGTTRVFQVRRVDGSVVQRTATTRVYDLDPVPAVAQPVLSVQDRTVGYVQLRTFVETADPPLRQALRAFQAAQVTDVVVDLRYNGGGLVSIAETFASLLRANHAGDTMYRMHLNARHVADESTTAFGSLAEAIAPARVAFIVTGRSASASELLVNVLQPYLGANLAIVGGRTYGKPVGQFAFEDKDCDAALYLISFQLLNADGTGDYFAGLPDANFKGASCAALDDLTHPAGDPTEASTAAALQWIATGACPTGPIPPAVSSALAAAAAEPPWTFPEAPEPTVAQRHMPGLF